ncbi:hypothetical protein CAXC1_70018 [Candidatus Xenohaliotis californiensis]|uniref:Uncharacterized protein n=1 Tax=Candidatus Xenohaliotis californiensis TaxID=84677 RepID=A0ABM9N998_9RICK|nr:hypothetical protein CAXC1_70018 [Candidatus Xenohaliotis californiensis]
MIVVPKEEEVSKLSNFIKHYLYNMVWSFIFISSVLLITAMVFIATYLILLYCLMPIAAISPVATIAISIISIVISFITAFEFGLWTSVQFQSLPILLHEKRPLDNSKDNDSIVESIQSINELIVKAKNTHETEECSVLLKQIETQISDMASEDYTHCSESAFRRYFIFLVNAKVFVKKIREFTPDSHIVKQLIINYNPFMASDRYLCGSTSSDLKKLSATLSGITEIDASTQKLVENTRILLETILSEASIFVSAVDEISESLVAKNTWVTRTKQNFADYNATLKNLSKDLEKNINSFKENPNKDNLSKINVDLKLLNQGIESRYQLVMTGKLMPTKVFVQDKQQVPTNISDSSHLLQESSASSLSI